jgi:hypothetical protein
MEPKFEPAILTHFSDIITSHGFQVKYRPNSFIGDLQLVNDKCIIRFIFDNPYVLCDFTDPVEKREKEKIIRPDGFPPAWPVYPIFTLWKFLYPGDTLTYEQKPGDIDQQVRSTRNLIHERFTNVLNGDFSWAGRYKDCNAKITNKIRYMMTQWPADNPVRTKFNHGNPDWEKDFDEYKDILDRINKPG